MKLEISVIISQIIAFLFMLWILKLFAWKPYLKLLSERRSKIQQEFLKIDLEKEELNKLSEQYHRQLAQIDEEARSILHDATTKAHAAAAHISEAARKEAKESLNQVKKAIDLEITEAHQQIKKNLISLVMGATEKMIEEKVESDEDKRKISEFIERVTLK
jgi:F-type H+-transporting ATPase subunit b